MRHDGRACGNDAGRERAVRKSVNSDDRDMKSTGRAKGSLFSVLHLDAATPPVVFSVNDRRGHTPIKPSHVSKKNSTE